MKRMENAHVCFLFAKNLNDNKKATGWQRLYGMSSVNLSIEITDILAIILYERRIPQ